MAVKVSSDLTDSIAIIGMAGRFPGANSLTEFWRNLAGGVESIRFFSEADLAAVPQALLAHPQFVRAKGVIDDIESFDAGFFGYTPPEARAMDPQHRLFLESGWHALESAGYDPGAYAGSIGVYAGLSINSYLLANVFAHPEVATSLGVDKDFLTTRLSYKLNLKGPSMAVQTACSTSLVAVCQACSALLSYQCDMALAGGVSISVPRIGGHWYQEGGIMSPDGHCRAFDAGARGTVAGSGLGIVVLKRLPEAVNDGDVIHAVIRGFAVNNDGSLKIGYTAPSVQGQAQVIAGAQALAGVDPETITYVEAHGTGTELGDPIEMAALTQVFRAATGKTGFCAVGSVKTNIGHLDTAAGIASLIKTVLALEHRQLPPSLHYRTPNPKIDFVNSPFFVNTELTDWNAGAEPRRAGVSSFGIGGTNAHVVLEEAPDRGPSSSSKRPQLLSVSTRSEASLEVATANLVQHLLAHPDQSLADVAYTLHVGRRKFPHARVAVCRTPEDAVAALTSQDRRSFASGVSNGTGEPPLVFMFPGQGAQHPNMGRQLYESELTFRQHVDACSDRLQRALGFDLRDVLYPAAGAADAAAERLQETLVTQCALFVIEYALAQLWMSWGIRPGALVGHSVGEYVAACLSDVLSLDDALRLLVARGQLMQAAPRGAMVAVPLSEERVRELLNDITHDLSIAAVNGPSQCVVAGSGEAVEAFETRLRDEAVTYQRLLTGGAFHSSLMAGVVGPLEAAAGGLRIGSPRIPYVSNVTGGWIEEADVRDSAYWGRHTRETVRFGASIDSLLAWGAAVFLEVGPGQALTALVRQQVRARGPAAANVEAIPSLPSPREAVSDGESVVRALGRLWLAGLTPDWAAYYANERRLRLELPTYPFERTRYWADPADAVPGVARPAAGAANRRASLDSWFAIPSWTRTQPPALASVEPGRWLVFLDDSRPAEQLADGLERRNHFVIRVRPGTGFVRTGERDYTIDPASRPDYDALAASLVEADRLPDGVLHLWGLTGRTSTAADRADDAFLERCQVRGFDSLLHLAQAWGDRASATTLEVCVVTDPIHDVTGHDEMCPEKATVLGPVRVMPQEYATVSCRLIDVVVTDAGFQPRALDQVLAEIESGPAEPVVAYRGIDRWIQTAEPVRLDGGPERPRLLRKAGVYLITGGYGAVGLEIGRYLASSVGARLVLVGRGGVPARELWQKHISLHGRDDEVSRRIRAVQVLEESGAEVLAARADVASLVQMRDVVARARKRFGRIDGVFHAAGIAGGGMMQLRKAEAVAAVLRPKVAGTRVLDRVLADDRPDFMLLCSSLNAVTGGVGQADYCAANAFLDAFARYQTARCETLVVSVNWDTWRDAGMAVDAKLPADLARGHDRSLKRGISSSEGIEALRRCLNGTVPQVLVSTGGWVRAGADAGETTSTEADHQGAAVDLAEPASLPLNPRPNLASPYVAPADEVHQKICDLWREALGVRQVGTDDSFFDLGGHSLLAIQVMARLNADFGTAIPVAKLYEGLTPAFLAGLVREAQPDRIDQTVDAGDRRERHERQKQQKRQQEKRRAARTGQGRLVQ